MGYSVDNKIKTKGLKYVKVETVKTGNLIFRLMRINPWHLHNLNTIDFINRYEENTIAKSRYITVHLSSRIPEQRSISRRKIQEVGPNIVLNKFIAVAVKNSGQISPEKKERSNLAYTLFFLSKFIARDFGEVDSLSKTEKKLFDNFSTYSSAQLLAEKNRIETQLSVSLRL